MEILQESEDDTGFVWFPEEEGGQDIPADNEMSLAKQAPWALKCFQTWLNTKKLKIDLKSVSKKELGVVLRQWYGSIRTSRGEQYSLGSYQSLRSGLNRYINDPPISRSWNLIQDPEFASANIVFKRVAGELKSAGKGRGTSFHPISPEDQRILKQSKALNPDNPLGLLNKVWFDIQLHFGHIGKRGFRDHHPDSFTLKCDEHGAKYFTTTCNEETAPLDREHHRAVMWEERGSPLCPVLSLEKYLKKIPPNATHLYLKPRKFIYQTDTYWYSSIPMRGKDLLQMLPSMCREAGTHMYTYRHLTATSKQVPLHAGFESREVMAVNGGRMKQLPSRSTSSGSNDKKMIRLSKSEMRAMVEQEIQRTIKENEARLQVLINTFEQLESGDDYEHSIQKLEARINIVAKKAEAALACIITEKKNPPSSLVNIKNEIERTVPQDKSADSVEKDADLFQMMENTRKSLKKMQSETKAVKAAIAGLGRTEDLPPPVLTPYGSPNFKGHASFIKKEVEATPENANAEEQEQIQEPKAKRVKMECLSTDQSIIPARNTMEVHSYPPLPSIPFPSVLSMEAASYNIPPRPEVQVALIRDPPGLSVLWNLEKADPCAAPMDSYRVYMTAEKVTGTDNFSDWMIVGEVRAIELPIGVMVNKYKSGCKTCVAVVGKDIFNRFGPFSKVVSVVIPK